MSAKPEVWLCGPIEGVPPLLQPVAHGLLQCRDEVRATISGMTADQLWSRPGSAASIGFHVRHAMGSLDRLFTYAAGRQLDEAQREALRAEGSPQEGPTTDRELVAAFDAAVDVALDRLRSTSESTLLAPRDVGRSRAPSTVIGLLFHAAEHTQRHIGHS